MRCTILAGTRAGRYSCLWLYKVFTRLTGTTQGRKSVLVENLVGGKGKFKGIRGQMRGNLERTPGSNSLTADVSGEYWLEQ
jgi:hypothetical protein